MTIELLLSGYASLEAPCLDDDGTLYFSDVHGGGVYRRSADGDVTTVVPKRRAVGGMALHEEGLVFSGRNVQVHSDRGSRVVLSDPGVRCYNDLGVDPQGRVLVGSVRDLYPDGTPIGGPGMEPEHRRRPYGELYRVGPDGVEMLYEIEGLSNGIAFSPDGSTMYHVCGNDGLVVHDVDANGNLHRREVWDHRANGGADGICMDRDGFLWTAGTNGIHRWDPSGRVVEHIEAPTTHALSVRLESGDEPHAYITTMDTTLEGVDGGAILRTRVDVPGLRMPKARC